jgi:hypothetical protein
MKAERKGTPMRGWVFGKLILPWIPNEAFLVLNPNGKRAQKIRKQRKKRTFPGVLHDSFCARLEAAEELVGVKIDNNAALRPYQLTKIRSGQMTHRIEGWAAEGAHFGLHYTYPMLDRRVIEFALGLPPEMYVRDGYYRWLFRRAMEGILPDETRWNMRKDDPALMSNGGSNRMSLAQAYVYPVVKDVIDQWIAAGGDFHSLDPQRTQHAAARLVRNDIDRDKPEENEDKLISALQVEQLLNPAFANAVEAGIATIQAHTPKNETE